MESFLLDEASWSSGLAPNDYFSGLGNYRNLVLSLYREAVVADEERARVAAALGALTSEGQGVGTTRTTRDAVSSTGKPSEEQPPDRLRLLVLTEDWCGDSATTLPYIARLAEALDLPIRVFRQSANPAIKAWYVDRGTEHIPVVSLLRRSSADGDASAPGAAGGWQEVVRWVERPAAAHIRVEAWLAEQPRFTELLARKDEDPAAAREYFSLYARLLRTMAGWYRSGLWSEIAVEFAVKIGENTASK
jgi:hypothetical protein